METIYIPAMTRAIVNEARRQGFNIGLREALNLANTFPPESFRKIWHPEVEKPAFKGWKEVEVLAIHGTRVWVKALKDGEERIVEASYLNPCGTALAPYIDYDNGKKQTNAPEEQVYDDATWESAFDAWNARQEEPF
jgi:hypothetical protein